MKSHCLTLLYATITLLCCQYGLTQTIDLTTEIKVLYQEGFENTNHGWSASNGVWEVGRPTSEPNRAHSGTNCAATILSGNYPRFTDSRFASPYIVLPPRNNYKEVLLLSLWEWHIYHSYNNGADHVEIEICKKGSLNWTKTKTIFKLESQAWTNTIIDISNYFDSTIQIGFWHEDDDESNSQASGISIDDIEIHIEPPREVPIPTEIIPWKQMALGGPAPRREASMIYDTIHNQIFLFGGRNDTENFGDSWTWSGIYDSVKWNQITATGPSPRFGAAMAYDSKRSRIVLFGGSSGARLNDTWVFDGTKWSEITVTNGPSRRTNAAMAFDANFSLAIMFGGMDGLTRFGETWQWDGAAWTQTATDGPSPRAESGMAYDDSRKKIILFGGRDTANYYNDTWEYDIRDKWKKLTTANNPSPRSAQNCLTYDSQSKRIVLYGGSNESGVLRDTWEFDGTSWFHTADAGPHARSGSALAYNVERDRVVLFGGTNSFENVSVLGDTWEYQGGEVLAVNWHSPLDSAAEFSPVPGGFDSFPAGKITVGLFPEEVGPFPTAYTDGQGVVFDMARGQVYLLMFPTIKVGDNTVLIRASVRATAPGSAIALAVLDPSDNSVGTNIPNNSQIFMNEFKRMVITFDPPGDLVAPIFQVSNVGNIEPVTVYMDNIEVILLPRDKNRSIYGE